MRATADSAADEARLTLENLVSGARQAMQATATEAIDAAFKTEIMAQLTAIEEASARAVTAANGAADRLMRQLITIMDTSANVEARAAEAAAAMVSNIYSLTPGCSNATCFVQNFGKRAYRRPLSTTEENKLVALHCATDAILPAWAFMLVSSYVSKEAKKVVHGSLADLEMALYYSALETIDFSVYQNKPVIIKGCSKKPVPESAYIMAVQKLQPFAKSIMYGEACSAVPLYKESKK